MKILSDFYIKNIKDAFNDGLPHITHFVVLHPFLKRSQTFLTFIRHLKIIKSNLIKQKKKRPSLSNKVQIIPYTLFIVIILNIFCV